MLAIHLSLLWNNQKLKTFISRKVVASFLTLWKSRFSNWPVSKGNNSESIHDLEISWTTFNVRSLVFMRTYYTQLSYMPFWRRRFLKTGTVTRENFTKISVLSKWRQNYHFGLLNVSVKSLEDDVISIHWKFGQDIFHTFWDIAV